MSELEVIANLVTTFAEDGSLDETAYRAHMDRLAAAGVGFFVGSPGSGEVHSLTLEEFARTCELAVETGRGRVPVYSMTPELHDVPAIIDFARAGAAAGVDEVQLFQLMGGHGMKPTADEQLGYWRTVLEALDQPTAVSLHAGVAGYLAPPSLVGGLCREFPQIRTVFTYVAPLHYVLEIRDAVPDGVRVGGHLARGAAELALGTTVLTGAKPNVIPRTARALVDAFGSGDIAGLQQAAQRIERFAHALQPWTEPNSRALKMALRVLGLPGGASTVRPPLVQPGEAELRRLAAALDAIGLTDWERPVSGS